MLDEGRRVDELNERGTQFCVQPGEAMGTGAMGIKNDCAPACICCTHSMLSSSRTGLERESDYKPLAYYGLFASSRKGRTPCPRWIAPNAFRVNLELRVA